MSKIKLLMPENVIAQARIPVRITDINYGNHVGNDAFVRIIHEARMIWLKEHGFTELNAGGAGLIMSNLEMEFKSQGRYGDVIIVKIACGEKTRAGFDLYYELSIETAGEAALLAIAKSGMVCYDYTENKVVSIPPALLQLL